MNLRKQIRILVYPLLPILLVGLSMYFYFGRPFDDTFWWILAVLLFGIGDTVTTLIAVKYDNLEEGMPFVRDILGREPGLAGLVIFTAFWMTVLYLGYMALYWNPFRDVIPVGLTIWGVVAVVNNSREIIRERLSS